MGRSRSAVTDRSNLAGAARTLGLLLLFAAALGTPHTQAAPPARPAASQRNRTPARRQPTRPQPAQPAQPPNPAATPGLVSTDSAPMHHEALQAEKRFAQEMMQQFRVQMTFVETPHFLIWTTLQPQQHQVLAAQCEAMYAALLRIFQLPADQPVFLGKCAVFVLSNQEQFKAFCQYVQQIPPDHARRAVGFQIGLPDGRSRIIAFWPGNVQELAETLVHEGSHAFLQRFGGNSHVLPWFNEGLAEHVTATVFQTRCNQGREAMQRAIELVRNDPQILSKMLMMDDSLPGEFYPLAQSVVTFLVQTDGKAFVQMIKGLKNTEPFSQVLQKTYNASVPQLDTHWRKWLQQTAESGRPVY